MHLPSARPQAGDRHPGRTSPDTTPAPLANGTFAEVVKQLVGALVLWRIAEQVDSGGRKSRNLLACVCRCGVASVSPRAPWTKPHRLRWLRGAIPTRARRRS
jgi:hypothetical protein